MIIIKHSYEFMVGISAPNVMLSQYKPVRVSSLKINARVKEIEICSMRLQNPNLFFEDVVIQAIEKIGRAERYYPRPRLIK